MELEGYLDKEGVCLTSNKFKGFKYRSDSKVSKEFKFDTKVIVPADKFAESILFLRRVIDSFIKDGCMFTIKVNKGLDGEGWSRLILSVIDVPRLQATISVGLNYLEGEGTEVALGIRYVDSFLRNFKKENLKGEGIKIALRNNSSPVLFTLGQEWMVIAPIIIQ